MFDNRIGEKLRLVWGLRAEYVNLNKVNQVLDTAFANINKGKPEKDQYDYSDLLNREPNLNLFPSANLTYSLTPKMNFRLAYAKSIVRPDLRELSYFREYDFELGGAYTAGLIRSTLIHNLDFRYEWYPNPGEIISISLFYKKLDYPMEIYKVGDNREYELRNNKSAKNRGIEVELRKSLAFTGLPVIKHLTLYGNFTALDARVTPMLLSYNQRNPDNPLKITPIENIGEEEKRPQTGASNFMYNAGAYYDDGPFSLSMSYNYVTNRMFRPNIQYAFSLFERPLESLDGQLAFRLLKKRAEVKLNVSNLLGSSSVVYINRYDDPEINNFKKAPNTQQLLYQKDKDVVDFETKPGRTFSLSFSYQF
ncbi:TonB-dependent receptor domain-containing protein [Mucilaginibacter gracilis]|uniref:TonB-dependent receptor domain-containing protein n=1 Tax=Mucilaginibacter gracilis TaxID=423350 RepID=UPI000EAC26EC|nr:TonB-dependent receptor [Mucilaginibacter gracilis]